MATGLGPRDLYFVFIVPMLVGSVAVLSVGRPAPETGRVTRATEERIAT